MSNRDRSPEFPFQASVWPVILIGLLIAICLISGPIALALWLIGRAMTKAETIFVLSGTSLYTTFLISLWHVVS